LGDARGVVVGEVFRFEGRGDGVAVAREVSGGDSALIDVRRALRRGESILAASNLKSEMLRRPAKLGVAGDAPSCS
jgi:hypothetical protein